MRVTLHGDGTMGDLDALAFVPVAGGEPTAVGKCNPGRGGGSDRGRSMTPGATFSRINAAFGVEGAAFGVPGAAIALEGTAFGVEGDVVPSRD